MTEREDAIRRIKTVLQLTHTKSLTVTIPRYTAELVVSLLKEQEAVETNEWIKCSDEMPEEQETIFAKFKGTDKWSNAMCEKMSEDVRVVVVFEDGTRRVHHSYTVDGKWEIEKSPLKRKVTHWMPNPKLPKEGWRHK